jgi:hypothetical protein
MGRKGGLMAVNYHLILFDLSSDGTCFHDKDCFLDYKSKTSSHTAKNENLRNSRRFLGHYRTIETASSNQTKSCVASKRSVPVGLPPWTSSEVRSRPRSNAPKLGDLGEFRVDFFCWVFIQR